MDQRLRHIWGIIKETFIEFFDDNPFAHSAAIAFYTIFSMPAILIIIIRIASVVFGESLVRGKISGRVSRLIDSGTAEQLEKIIQNAAVSDASPFMAFVGIAMLIFSATTVFTIVQNALNHMWQVKPKPQREWLKLIRDRLLSVIMVLVLGLLVLLSLLADLLITVLRDLINDILPGNYAFLLPIATGIISLVFVTLVFTFIFKFLPDAYIKWKDAFVGAIVTTLLFSLGKYLIQLYLSTTNLASTYGAAGALVLMLIWVNYSSMILLLGAEFTQVFSKASGRKIRPAKYAVKVHLKEIESEE